LDPVIQPGNEMFVHHILIYQCSDTVDVSNIIAFSSIFWKQLEL